MSIAPFNSSSIVLNFADAVHFSSHSKEVPGLKGVIYKNIDSLRRIRRTHTALLSTVAAGSQANDDEDMPRRNLQAVRRPDPPPLSQFLPSIGDLNGRIKGRVPATIPIEGGSKLANKILRSNCAQLLEHSGFEGEFATRLSGIYSGCCRESHCYLRRTSFL